MGGNMQDLCCSLQTARSKEAASNKLRPPAENKRKTQRHKGRVGSLNSKGVQAMSSQEHGSPVKRSCNATRWRSTTTPRQMLSCSWALGTRDMLD